MVVASRTTGIDGCLLACSTSSTTKTSSTMIATDFPPVAFTMRHRRYKRDLVIESIKSERYILICYSPSIAMSIRLGWIWELHRVHQESASNTSSGNFWSPRQRWYQQGMSTLLFFSSLPWCFSSLRVKRAYDPYFHRYSFYLSISHYLSINRTKSKPTNCSTAFSLHFRAQPRGKGALAMMLSMTSPPIFSSVCRQNSIPSKWQPSFLCCIQSRWTPSLPKR